VCERNTGKSASLRNARAAVSSSSSPVIPRDKNKRGSSGKAATRDDSALLDQPKPSKIRDDADLDKHLAAFADAERSADDDVVDDDDDDDDGVASHDAGEGRQGDQMRRSASTTAVTSAVKKARRKALKDARLQKIF
jgi:hypothetical protein